MSEAAGRYFVGNAQPLKQMEMIETSLRNNSKVVITEHGISPTILLGSLPTSVSREKAEQQNPRAKVQEADRHEYRHAAERMEPGE